jgi:hypothetical protein
MALNFPPTPSLNQTYSFAGKIWIWNGYAWNLSATGAINGLPVGNITPSTGTFTTLSATGNITTTANVAGNYFLGNGAFLSGVSTSGASSISSGSSNIRIETAGGNIQANVGGTANVWTLATTGEYVTGEISASGNVTANNFIGNANASSLLSGTVPSGRLTGTYSINISGIAATANTVTDAAQPNITSVGTLTALSVSGNAVAANFNTAGLVSATGNIVGGNVSTAGLVTATGNVTGGNLVTGGRVVATGNITSTGNVTGGNVIATALVSAGGNVTGGNITTGGLITATGNITATANIAGGNLITTGLITATGEITSTANVTGNNLITSGSGGNITGANVVSATSFTAAGNITGGNFITGGLISATGNVTGNYFLGNGACLTGVITSVANINNGTTNVRIDSAGGNIQANVGGTANVFTVATTGFFVTGVSSVSGTITGGNLVTAGTASAAGNVTGGNVITGGVVTATGNITSTANVAGANVNASGNVSAVGNVNAGNLTVTNSVVSTTLTVNGDATVAGNLTVSGTTANVNVTNLNIQDPVIGLGRGANNTPLTTNDGKDRGEQLWYYSGTEKSAFVGYKNASGKIIAAVDVTNAAEVITVNDYGNFLVGNLEAIIVSTSGNISAVGNITGNYFLGNGSQLTGIAADGSAYKTLSIVGNVTGASSGNSVLTANTTVGILNVTAANGITMVGNATTNTYTIGVSGSTDDGTLWGAGGDCGLVTDATTPPNYDNGLVTDAVTSAYDLGVLTGALPGGPVNAIQFNADLTSFGGSANLVWSGTGANVVGYVSVLGNITGSNANITGTTAATSKTTGALTVAGGVGVAGDLYAGNSVVVDGGTYGNVITTQFASVFGRAYGLNATSLMQVKGNDGTAGIGMRAVTGSNSLIYSNSAIDLRVGSNVRDLDTPAGGTTIAIVASTGVSVTGLITATGNVSGNYILGNGALLTGVITSVANINSGTSNVTVVSSGGNVTTGVGGIPDVVIVASSGMTVSNVSITGNISGAGMLNPFLLAGM